MIAPTTRILKEARPLFWPWCAMMLGGALPLVYPLDWAPLIYLLGFLGLPLLATLSLGNEFQHRTFPLLLSQPVGRMGIWGEKLGVTTVAVLSAVLAFSLAVRATSFRAGPQEVAFAGAWMIACIASAPYWTLVARSTAGGVTLMLAGAWVIASIAAATYWTLVAHSAAGGIPFMTAVQLFVPIALHMPNWPHGTRHLSASGASAMPTLSFIFLAYAGIMIWLGRRRLARFQVAEAMAGEDLLTGTPHVLPKALISWFRCRPIGAGLNLFRKEFRLLRPVWLMTMLAAAVWGLMTLYGVHEQQRSSEDFQLFVISVGVVTTLLIAIFAGSLSLGEERTAGTHAWNLALPASSFLQWRIKLYVALFTGLVGAGLVPLVIAPRLFGKALPDLSLGADWLVVVVLLAFVAFWCACATNGTVRAVLWVFPVAIALGLAWHLGGQAGSNLMEHYVSRFHPFADIRLTLDVVSWINPSRHFLLSHLVKTLWWYDWIFAPLLLILMGAALVLALFQSYRMFRSPLADSIRPLLRNLSALVVIVFLFSSSLMAFRSFVGAAWEQHWNAIRETFAAIEKMQPGAGMSVRSYPIELTEEDLARVYPLSPGTRGWLRVSPLTVVPLMPLPHHEALDGFPSYDPSKPDDNKPWYLVTLRLAGGTSCRRAVRSWWKRDLRVVMVVCE